MRVWIFTTLVACTVLSAAAADEVTVRSNWHPVDIPLGKRTAAPAPDPFLAPARPLRAPVMELKSGGACGVAEFQVCMDSSGRLSVPGAKRFLPALPGLTPERLTVKRHGISVRYSF